MLMLDEIKASEINDANLKNYVETNTYISCNDLVSDIISLLYSASIDIAKGTSRGAFCVTLKF